jgi:hypothetical protein
VSRSGFRSLFLGAAATAWIAAVTTGFAMLLTYKNTPAVETGRPPSIWPGGSAMRRVPGRATLVMFAHPHCPCTQASLSELARLLPRVSAPVDTRVVIVRPPGVDPDWDDTGLRQRAAAIPGVTLVRDEGGLEAARFRAGTSGLVVLYDATGRRLFSGGITASRGHEGDSAGGRRLFAALKGEQPDSDRSPVFGCALVGDHRSIDTSTTSEDTP